MTEHIVETQKKADRGNRIVAFSGWLGMWCAKFSILFVCYFLDYQLKRKFLVPKSTSWLAFTDDVLKIKAVR